MLLSPNIGRSLLGTGALVAVAATVSVACGSRSILRESEVEPHCEEDRECDQSNLCAKEECVSGECQVVAPVLCGPAGDCFEQLCNPATGLCEQFSLTEDVDGDGARAPLVGYRPGAPGSCGDDCDDSNPAAFPGGDEVCDGADNDCDGVIDNGSGYLGIFADEFPAPVRVSSSEMISSGTRGAAFGDGVFAVGYWGASDGIISYIAGLGETGLRVFPETPAAQINGPSLGADLAWSGEAFGAAWSDPRVDDSYEIYFALFDSAGTKLGPDVRVTDADEFSIHPRVIFDQGRFLIVWDDRRDQIVTGGSKIFAQLLGRDGAPIGDNIQLSDDAESAEYPYIAATNRRFGLVYTSTEEGVTSLRVRTLDKETLGPSGLTVVTDAFPRGPRIVAVGDRFVVTWETYDVTPGPEMMGAVLSEEGEILIAPRAITSPAPHARYHDTLSLGDRFLLAWNDDLFGNYELNAKVLDADLREVEPRRRLTNDENDTAAAELALGDRGRVGVFFDDWRSGTHQNYFLSVGCGEPTPIR